MDHLNYHQLLHFWTVAREGSIQRASERLHVTPANVSGQIKKLERSLKIALLQKQGRGVVVTETGREVARYAEKIFSTGQELVQAIKGRPADRPRMFRVGVRDVMPKLVAFRFLQPAMDLDPAMKLDCHEGKLPDLLADLAIHKLDLVLSDHPLDPTYRIQARSHLIGRSDVVIVGTTRLAQKYQSGFPDSLEHADFVLPTEDTVLRRDIDNWFESKGIAINVRGQFDDSAMIKVAARNELGFMVAPALIEDDLQQLYGLVRIGKVSGVREDFYAIAVRQSIDHPAVSEVIRTKLES